jgi:hypothetical protein
MKPPDKTRAAPAEDRAALERTDSARSGNTKPKAGRRENQGIASDRNACQRAPAWPDPPEAEAFRILDLHWGRKL